MSASTVLMVFSEASDYVVITRQRSVVNNHGEAVVRVDRHRDLNRAKQRRMI